MGVRINSRGKLRHVRGKECAKCQKPDNLALICREQLT